MEWIGMVLLPILVIAFLVFALICLIRSYQNLYNPMDEREKVYKLLKEVTPGAYFIVKEEYPDLTGHEIISKIADIALASVYGDNNKKAEKSRELALTVVSNYLNTYR